MSLGPVSALNSETLLCYICLRRKPLCDIRSRYLYLCADSLPLGLSPHYLPPHPIYLTVLPAFMDETPMITPGAIREKIITGTTALINCAQRLQTATPLLSQFQPLTLLAKTFKYTQLGSIYHWLPRILQIQPLSPLLLHCLHLLHLTHQEKALKPRRILEA